MGKLLDFYDALTSGFTIHSGLELPQAQGADLAVKLAGARASVSELYALYKNMYGWFGLGFTKAVSQQLSLRLCQAGANYSAFTSTYISTWHQAGADAALQAAVPASVKNELNGVVRRYAKEDAQPYTAGDYQMRYGTQWLDQWLASPLELRVSSDSQAYTAEQYRRHFGSSWEAQYRSSDEAIQMLSLGDTATLSMQGFQKVLGESWQAEWAKSTELPCRQCRPYLGVGELRVLV